MFATCPLHTVVEWLKRLSERKRQNELYSSPRESIFGPEGLTLDPPRGVATIELNQGDTKSGRIARSDVARVCVEAIYRYGGLAK